MGAPASRWAAALVACALLGVAKGADIVPGTAAFPPASPAVVCASPNAPMGDCLPNAPASEWPGSYDVDLFRAAAARIGWVEGVDFTFRCGTFDEVVATLKEPDGFCSLAPMGMTASLARREAGIKFAFPTYKASLAIMVVDTPAPAPDGWQFLDPFTWDLWLAMAATALLFPVVAFVLELLSVQGRILRHDWFVGLREATWRSWWSMLMYEPFQVTSLAARAAAVGYGFLALLVFNSYIANLTAETTVSRLTSGINSVDDLRGKGVGTFAVYTPRLAKYGIQARGLPFADDSSYAEWAAALRNGSLVALVGDEPIFSYLVAGLGCDLRLLDFTLEPYDTAWAFKEGTPDSVIAPFSEAILELVNEGVAADLRSKYITGASANSTCPAKSAPSTATQLADISGLWVILGAAAGLGAVILGVTTALERRRARQQAAEVAAAALAAEPAAAAEGSFAAKGKAGGAPFAVEQLLAGVRELCDAHEDLKRRHTLLLQQVQSRGYGDDDNGNVIDETLLSAPIVRDFAGGGGKY